MPVFRYKAKSKDGSTKEGKLDAQNRFELARKLREQGYTVLHAEDESRKRGAFLEHVTAKLNRVKLKEKILFANNLSTMIGAGLSLSRSLSVMSRETRNPKLKEVVESISGEVTKGSNFSDALARFPETFPPIFVAMVSSGEESGNLPESLKLIADQLEKSYDLRRKVRGAMIYPAIVLTVIVIIGILMMIFLVPTLSETFESLGAELPLTTQFIIGTSSFLAAYIYYILAVFFVFALVLWRFILTPAGKRSVSFLLLHLPVVKNITEQANAALTMRTLSSLISSGVSILRSLEITQKVVQNPYYVEVLRRAGTEVQKGGSLSAVFQAEEKLYPVLVGEMIAVGEETGQLSGMLLKGAVFYEDEVDSMTKNLSTILEPVLMVLVGSAVGFFAVSMIQPMYSLSEVI